MEYDECGRDSYVMGYVEYEKEMNVKEYEGY